MHLLEGLVLLKKDKKTYGNCSSRSLADLQEGKCFHSSKMRTTRLSTVGRGGRFRGYGVPLVDRITDSRESITFPQTLPL